MKWNLKKIVSEIVSMAFLVLVIFAFKSSFVANYTVPTPSMRPTIEPGDKLIVNKMAFDLRVPFTKIRLMEFDKPQRGDVIVFDPPHDGSVPFIKRLIGLPGDLIEVEDGFITLNGEPLKMSITPGEIDRLVTDGGTYTETLGEKTYTVRRIPKGNRIPSLRVRVPDDHYFAMGDNRDESADSRVWGFVPKENIWGRAKFVYFAFDWSTFTVFWNRIGNTF